MTVRTRALAGLATALAIGAIYGAVLVTADPDTLPPHSRPLLSLIDLRERTYEPLNQHGERAVAEARPRLTSNDGDDGEEEGDDDGRFLAIPPEKTGVREDEEPDEDDKKKDEDDEGSGDSL